MDRPGKDTFGKGFLSQTLSFQTALAYDPIMRDSNGDADSREFVRALVARDLGGLKAVPKADLHNHALLGGRLADYRAFCGVTLPDPPEFFDFKEFDRYVIVDIATHLEGRPNRDILQDYHFLFARSLEAARRNGVTVLETSLDCSFLDLYEGRVEELVADFGRIIAREAGPMRVKPELGMARVLDPKRLESLALPCMESGFFASIDLYSDEREGELASFVPLYRRAASLGLKKKAHAGELRSAEFVRESVETLELDAVQHGIAAARSADVMRWLADRGTSLNVCPTSNIKLKRAEDYAGHPLRTLVDHGVRVSLGSDDALVFGSEVSEEYLRLYESGSFTAEELDAIRLTGLSA